MFIGSGPFVVQHRRSHLNRRELTSFKFKHHFTMDGRGLLAVDLVAFICLLAFIVQGVTNDLAIKLLGV